jgi:hypothetical protein
VKAMKKWLDFYIPHFNKESIAIQFVKECEKQSPPLNTAKIMMHQAQRLICLADQVLKIRPNDESLYVFFLIMCTENISKLHDSFMGEGKSRFYVKRFFKKFLSEEDKEILANGFIDEDDKSQRPLGFERAVDMLYDIRCDVVHEGNYIGFYFCDDKSPIQNTNPNVTANLRLRDVRNIIVRGCIKAAESKL